MCLTEERGTSCDVRQTDDCGGNVQGGQATERCVGRGQGTVGRQMWQHSSAGLTARPVPFVYALCMSWPRGGMDGTSKLPPYLVDVHGIHRSHQLQQHTEASPYTTAHPHLAQNTCCTDLRPCLGPSNSYPYTGAADHLYDITTAWICRNTSWNQKDTL